MLHPGKRRFEGDTVIGAPIAIRKVRLGHEGDGNRVSADVDGHEVYFESPDLELVPSAEAMASAFLLPALLARRPLALESAVDGLLLEGAEQLQSIAGSWWGREPSGVQADAAASTQALTPTGLCFSGGVDSFYSLLRAEQRPKYLVSIVGYDMPLEDAPRIAAFEGMLESVSLALGVRSLRVETNLREHPLLLAVNWERVFGGALAAVGHLLTGTLGRLVIPSSFPEHFSVPYGTHARIDPLWSSTRLAVSGHGGEHWRFDKIRAVADEPLVREHLRVCWENSAIHGNCSRCEKCLRTLLTIEALGLRSAFSSFDQATPFPELVADYVPTGGMLAPAFEIELGRGLPPDVAQAVRDLAARSLSVRHMLDKRVGLAPRALRRLFGRRR